MPVSGQLHASADLHPGRTSSARSIGDCVGPRAGVDRFGEEKPLTPAGIGTQIYIYIYIYQTLYCPTNAHK